VSHEDIIRYYEKCEIDYRINWRMDECMSLHYGYWDEDTRSFPQAMQNVNRELVQRAGIRGGEQVLDAGCGVGGSAIYLAKHHRCRVTGITLVPGQVDRAFANAQRRGVGALVSFQERDYLRTGYSPGSFDVVWGIESVCYAEDKADFLREAFRLLRPGGRVVVADFFRSRERYDARDEELLRKWEACWAVPEYAVGSVFECKAREVGLDKVWLSDETDHVRRSARRLYGRFFPGLVANAMAVRLRIRDAVQTDDVWSAWYQWHALKRGLWRYMFFSAVKPG